MKRIFLFVVTNLAIVLVLSIVAQVTGLDAWLAQQGGSLEGLLVFAALFGFGGALISLAISKWMAVRTMGVRIIHQPETASEQWLLDTVRSLAGKAGVGMPEVGIFDSPQPNAFATGPRRDSALVAVSTGLLASMDRDAVQAVLGHEITHVANGDMVTLDADPGRGQHVRDLPVAHHRQHRRSLDVTRQRRPRAGLFHHRAGVAAGAGNPRDHHRHVVFAAA